MGNRFSTRPIDNADPEGPGDGVSFFRSLDVKWIDIFIGRIREIATDSNVDVFELSASLDPKTSYRLRWRDYFQIFVLVKDKIERDEAFRTRSSWHPATLGFTMQADDSPRVYEDVYYPTKKPLVDDDHTDDDMDDDDDEDEDDDDNESKTV